MSNVLPITPEHRLRQEEAAKAGQLAQYAELLATSNFSFLRGGSDPRELVIQAIAIGLSGLGIADRNSFAGVVRGYTALRDLKEEAAYKDWAEAFRYVVGVRLCFADGTPDIIAYPTDRDAYGRLCALLTSGNLRAEKGLCELRLDDLELHADGQLFILQADEEQPEKSEEVLRHLARLAPGRTWLAASCIFRGNDRERLAWLSDLAAHVGVPLLATNDVIYHVPERRMLQDVVTCIREHKTIFEAGQLLEQNAERHLKPATEMARLFRHYPDAVAQTLDFVSRINFSLKELEYSYPRRRSAMAKRPRRRWNA